MAFQTLRPGLLVSLKTSLQGNVSYRKEDIEAPYTTNDGEQVAKWETERTIADPEEFERAQQVRGKAGNCVRGVCAKSAFGLLCPETRVDDLDQAMKEARAMIQDFNTSASCTRLGFYAIVGKVARDDLEAVRAINSEVRDLLSDIESGMRGLDVKVIRDAANKARSLGAMLTPEAAEKIQIAIDTARQCARRIVKAGEEGAVEIDRAAIRKVTEQRSAFLDMDEAREIVAPVAIGRSIDLDPESSVTMPLAGGITAVIDGTMVREMATPAAPKFTFDL